MPPPTHRTRQPSAATLRGLDALNFVLADVRDGLGPYLATHLIAARGPSQGWNEATGAAAGGERPGGDAAAEPRQAATC